MFGTENLTRKTNQMTEMTTYNQKFIWPKAFFEKWSFDRKVIWPKVHMTESFFQKNARNFFPKNGHCFFSKKSHLTEWFFFRKMVIWLNKFLAKGKTTKVFLNFESASIQNRVWLPRCLLHCQAPCPRWKYKIQKKNPIYYNLWLLSYSLIHDWDNSIDNIRTIFSFHGA
jgi:hypothetical protein